MADPIDGHDEAALAIAARHALHDEELIAALADRALEPGDAERARGLIERCSACHDLHRDLTAITATLRASGTAEQVAAVRSAPRDFRLTPEMAGVPRPALTPAGLRARIADAFATFGRPLGASLATFGLVGLLVGSVSFGGLAGMASAPGAGGPAATAGAADGHLTGSAAASQRTSASMPISTTKEEFEGGPTTTDHGRDGTSVAGWLVGGSTGLLVLGLVLMVLGTRGRKAREIRVG